MKSAKFAFTCFLLWLLLSLIPAQAGPSNKNSRVLPSPRIVVSARRVSGSIEYTIGKLRYTKAALSDAIGEMRLSASGDSVVVIIMEDTMTLSDIKDVPRMALDAGFHDIRIFVYWKGTGNMAEVFFGPVVKHNLDKFPE